MASCQCNVVEGSRVIQSGSTPDLRWSLNWRAQTSFEWTVISHRALWLQLDLVKLAEGERATLQHEINGYRAEAGHQAKARTAQPLVSPVLYAPSTYLKHVAARLVHRLWLLRA